MNVTNNNNNNNSLDCSDLFLKDIEMLKEYRDILWTSQETSSFLVRKYIGDLPDFLEQRKDFKEYVSNDLYTQFETEYYMTIFLLEKCLIKAIKVNVLPKSEEDKKRVQDVLEKIAIITKKIPKENILEALRKEDPSVRKALERIYLSEEQIQKAIAKGFMVESVLDVEDEAYKL